MKIFDSLTDWMTFRKQLSPKQTLGFVPTMGNLHQGHISLFQKSKLENDITICSLFINPTQFNNKDDFTHYPRTLGTDLDILQESGVDYCLLPSHEAMYPDDFHYQVQENILSLTLEGQHRPGHFNGVLSVVMKLLNLVKPNRAYFGEKDYQQYALIAGMVKAYFMDIEIIPCTTIREASGLPYSSRNSRLSAEDKKKAEYFAYIFLQDKPCQVQKEALAEAGIKVDYLETFEHRKYAAVQISGVRLIDNIKLKE